VSHSILSGYSDARNAMLRGISSNRRGHGIGSRGQKRSRSSGRLPCGGISLFRRSAGRIALGAATGILMLDIGIVLSLQFSRWGPSRFEVLQLLMLVLSLTGLLLGTLISERDRTEKQLSQVEERMRLLLESVGEAVYRVDSNGDCTFCKRSISAPHRICEFSGSAGKKYA
jgi:PAS domain-containing protein